MKTSASYRHDFLYVVFRLRLIGVAVYKTACWASYQKA